VGDNANLNINLNAKDNASPALKKLTGQFGALGGKLSTLAGSAGPLALVAAGLVAIGTAAIQAGKALGKMTVEQAKVGDEAIKGANRLGLQVEAFSQLNFAAERSGASSKSVTTAMRTLARAALEARDGVATYTDVFNELGVSVVDGSGEIKDLKGLFIETAQALKEQESATVRLGLGQQVLGRGMTDLAVLINEGEDGIRALTEEADKYGATIRHDFGRASEKFVDSQSNINASIGNVKRTLVEGLMPELTSAINTLAGALQDPGLLAFIATLGDIAGTTTKLIIETGSRLMDFVDFLQTPKGAILLALIPGGLGQVLQGQAGVRTGLNARRPPEQFPGGQGASPGDTIGQGQGPILGPGGSAGLDERNAALLAMGGSLGQAGIVGAPSGRERLEMISEMHNAISELGTPVEEMTEKWRTHEEVVTAVGAAFQFALIDTGLAAINQLQVGFGQAVGKMIVFGEKLGTNLKRIFKNVIQNLIAQVATLFLKLLATSILAAYLGIGNPGAAGVVSQLLAGVGLDIGTAGGGGGGDSGSRALRGGATSSLLDGARGGGGRTANMRITAYQVPGTVDQQRELADIIFMRGRELGIV